MHISRAYRGHPILRSASVSSHSLSSYHSSKPAFTCPSLSTRPLLNPRRSHLLISPPPTYTYHTLAFIMKFTAAAFAALVSTAAFAAAQEGFYPTEGKLYARNGQSAPSSNGAGEHHH